MPRAMFNTLLIFVELLIGLEIANATELIYSTADGNVFIGTSLQNYALTGTLLASQGVKSVSVNGDSVIIITPTCETTSTNLDRVGPDARIMFDHLIDGDLTSSYGLSSMSKTTLMTSDRNGKKSFRMTFSQENPNQSSISIGQFTRAIYSPEFPKPLAHIIFDDQVVTYVYYNGCVKMKPMACTEGEERQFLEKYWQEDSQANEEARLELDESREARKQSRLALDEAKKVREIERQAREQGRQMRDQERQLRNRERQQIREQQRQARYPSESEHPRTSGY